MYLEYWGFNEKPFENTPDPRFMYHSPAHEETYARMKYVIDEKKGAAMITGEYGAGKTLLARVLAKELLERKNCDVALIVNPMLSKVDLLREIIFQLKAESVSGTKLKMLHLLNDLLYDNFNKNKNTVIIIDEAQVINRKDVFEELRLLLNFQLNDRFLLTLILIGQPELRKKIDNIPQLKQRLATSYHLGRLGTIEVSKYIHHRLEVAGAGKELFQDKAIDKISGCSEGLPRKINNICEIALLQGMFEKKNDIDDVLINNVVEDIS